MAWRSGMQLSLLVLALGVPVTGFLLPGLGRPSFGHLRCGVQASRSMALLAQGRQGTGFALMDAPYKDKDDAAKREFELNRGHAVDTLLADYPSIFVQSSDLSIFHESVVLRDSKGFSLEGIRAYKVIWGGLCLTPLLRQAGAGRNGGWGGSRSRQCCLPGWVRRRFSRWCRPLSTWHSRGWRCQRC